MDFNGKISVITGGVQGIGRCIAEELQKAGAMACGQSLGYCKHGTLSMFRQSGFITGENICIDGGMTHQMIYHGDHGWTLEVKTDKDRM